MLVNRACTVALVACLKGSSPAQLSLSLWEKRYGGGHTKILCDTQKPQLDPQLELYAARSTFQAVSYYFCGYFDSKLALLGLSFSHRTPVTGVILPGYFQDSNFHRHSSN